MGWESSDRREERWGVYGETIRPRTRPLSVLITARRFHALYRCSVRCVVVRAHRIHDLILSFPTQVVADATLCTLCVLTCQHTLCVPRTRHLHSRFFAVHPCCRWRSAHQSESKVVGFHQRARIGYADCPSSRCCSGDWSAHRRNAGCSKNIDNPLGNPWQPLATSIDLHWLVLTVYILPTSR